MNTFKFSLDQSVGMVCSNERGVVIGRAEYRIAEPAYLVRYEAGDGRQVESWWTESAIVAI